MLQAKVFSSSSGDCAAFLSNYHWTSTVRVTFNGRHYNLPPWSISILPDCNNVIYNTAQVSKHGVTVWILPVSLKRNQVVSFTCRVQFCELEIQLIFHISIAMWLYILRQILIFMLQVEVQKNQMSFFPTNVEPFSWETYNEDVSSVEDDSSMSYDGLLEQLNVTRDTSDYLWYTTR